VHAAQLSTHSAVDIEGLLHFAADVLEMSRLHAARGHLSVAVHRIRNPKHLAAIGAHRVDQAWEAVGDPPRAEPVNEGQPTRLALRIEGVDPPPHLLARDAVAYFHSHRVLDPAQILDMRAVGLRGPQTYPGKVRGEIEKPRPPRHAPRL